jgi:hypothetical protein
MLTLFTALVLNFLAGRLQKRLPYFTHQYNETHKFAIKEAPILESDSKIPNLGKFCTIGYIACIEGQGWRHCERKVSVRVWNTSERRLWQEEFTIAYRN